MFHLRNDNNPRQQRARSIDSVRNCITQCYANEKEGRGGEGGRETGRNREKQGDYASSRCKKFGQNCPWLYLVFLSFLKGAGGDKEGNIREKGGRKEEGRRQGEERGGEDLKLVKGLGKRNGDLGS